MYSWFSENSLCPPKPSRHPAGFGVLSLTTALFFINIDTVCVPKPIPNPSKHHAFFDYQVFLGYVFNQFNGNTMLNCCTTCISWEIGSYNTQQSRHTEHTHFCRNFVAKSATWLVGDMWDKWWLGVIWCCCCWRMRGGARLKVFSCDHSF